MNRIQRRKFDNERGIFILLLSVLDVCLYWRFYVFHALAVALDSRQMSSFQLNHELLGRPTEDLV